MRRTDTLPKPTAGKVRSTTLNERRSCRKEEGGHVGEQAEAATTPKTVTKGLGVGEGAVSWVLAQGALLLPLCLSKEKQCFGAASCCYRRALLHCAFATSRVVH